MDAELYAARVARYISERDEARDEARRYLARADHAERRLTDLNRALDPLCPCSTDPNSTSFGPLQECPVHGDGTTFVEYVQRLERVYGAALVWDGWWAAGQAGAVVGTELHNSVTANRVGAR